VNPLELQSERVLATGNIASEGVYNQLGRPTMDRLTLLVREAGQNSWDAKADDSDMVRFGADLYEVDPQQRRVLTETVFHATARALPLSVSLARRRDGPLRVLAISDRGTKGMGGPTRADVVGPPDEPRDFVDFLRNVGQPPDHIAAGTYGYGKAAFYRASGARTILVHTRCRRGATSETRFIAAALGESFVAGRVRYTGRHWWGRTHDEVVEPVTGASADALAASVGLPPFADAELGTTIAILDPQLDGRPGAAAMAHIGEAILWHFWPKMLPDADGRPTMTFRLTADGVEIPIPDPRDTPPLNGFAEAMAITKGQSPAHPIALETSAYDISSIRPAADLGKLALVKFGHVPRSRPVDDELDGAWAIPHLAHHVALVRGPELVVKYVQGPLLASATVEYAGVFRVDPSVEGAFARAEPPTHDDWSPDNLENDWEKRYVRIAKRRIDSILLDYAAPLPVAAEPTGRGGLGGFSDQLGILLLGEPGEGLSLATGGGSTGSGTGTRRKPTPQLRIVDDGHLEVFEGRPALRVEFTVDHAPGSSRSIVIGSAAAALDGHAVETDPPVGVAVPEIICWVSPDGGIRHGDRIIVSGAGGDLWRIYASVPADAAVTVDLRAVSGGPE
jgi:hypothetical protein